MNEHQHVNKEYKAPQRIMWHMLWSQTPETVSRLNNHVIVHIQSKCIDWSWGKNTRVVLIVVLIPGLSPLLTLVSPGILIKALKVLMNCADVCWTVSVVHNKEEYIQGFWIDTKTLKWNIKLVNLNIRACNKMLVREAD